MVRTALCQQHGAAIQYRCYCLYHYTCSEHHLGSYTKVIRKPARPRLNISFMLTIALLGIPFYGHGASSVIIGIIVLAALGLYLFAKKLDQKYQISARTMNTALLCTMMIMVGYSSYALIVIRSTANTPMDQNSPEDIFTLGEYLGREQYGTRPLFYGQAYSSKVELEVKDGYCVPVEANSTTKYIRKEKTSATKKTRTSRFPDVWNINMHKTCSSRVCTAAHTQHNTKDG